jgi:glycosyltransferase involved in cell wall biosynthesis
MGRPHERREGLLTLLDALAEVPGIEVVLVGDGPLEPALRARARELSLGDRLRFLGRKPREEVPALVLDADATILPSEWYENAPLALLESLALGRPVMASRIGGIPELLDDGETGWLFTAGDRIDLQRVLEAWRDDPAARRQRGERALGAARERFHPRDAFARTLALYHEVLDRGA